MSPRQTFAAIRQDVLELIDEQYQLWHHELKPALAAHGIHLHDFEQLGAEDKKWASAYFRNEVFPVLTPLAVDASHPFPHLQNKSHNLFLRLQRPERRTESLHAVVQIPRVLPRLVLLPSVEGARVALRADPEPDPGARARSCFPASTSSRSTASGSPATATSTSTTRKRKTSCAPSRTSCASALAAMPSGWKSSTAARLTCAAVLLNDFQADGRGRLFRQRPVEFPAPDAAGTSLDSLSALRDKPYVPVVSPALPTGCDIFEVLRRQDVLLHHPYESFSSVVEFLEHAADDPQVLAIKMTLYRTSGDSPIIRSLIRAAEEGKQVTALIELRARFDEANNINWARQLEDAGVHVVYGLVGLKTHSKVLLVVRRDEDRLRQYLHLGTGNYHPSTARFYTDLSVLTTNPELGEEVSVLFNTLTGLSEFKGMKQLIVAPFQMHDAFLKLIQHERDLARQGKEGRIIVKLNSLVEESLIIALYEASQAGVKIDLIVRGICCLRPGVPGVSENIRVISIVGRFLEHSRIYFFGNGGKPKVYLGSADWMPRNLYRRVEVVFPVRDPRPAQARHRRDPARLPRRLRQGARPRSPTASIAAPPAASGKKNSQAQLTFRNLAREAASRRVEKKKARFPANRPPPAQAGRETGRQKSSGVTDGSRRPPGDGVFAAAYAKTWRCLSSRF